MDIQQDNISKFLISIVGVAVILTVGLVVLQSLIDNGTTTSCQTGFTLNDSNSNACYNFTVINTTTNNELVPFVNSTVARSLAGASLNQPTCGNVVAMNSTGGSIPASNYTLPTSCSIRYVNGTTDGVKTVLNESVQNVNSTVGRQLSVVNLSDVVCSVIAAYNQSTNGTLIPANNYTVSPPCTIQATAGVNALWQNKLWAVNYTYYYQALDNQNWTINYTTVWTNITAASALEYRRSSAANTTIVTETQLAGVPTWIGIIITVTLAFIVLGYFYNRF